MKRKQRSRLISIRPKQLLTKRIESAVAYLDEVKDDLVITVVKLMSLS